MEFPRSLVRQGDKRESFNLHFLKRTAVLQRRLFCVRKRERKVLQKKGEPGLKG